MKIGLLFDVWQIRKVSNEGTAKKTLFVCSSTFIVNSEHFQDIHQISS